MPTRTLQFYQTILNNSLKSETYEMTLTDGRKVIGIPSIGSTAKPVPEQEFSMETDAGIEKIRLDQVSEIVKISKPQKPV